MEIVVQRSEHLRGEIQVPGAKNSVLKLMAITVLAEGTYRLSNVPDIADVEREAERGRALGFAEKQRRRAKMLVGLRPSPERFTTR